MSPGSHHREASGRRTRTFIIGLIGLIAFLAHAAVACTSSPTPPLAQPPSGSVGSRQPSRAGLAPSTTLGIDGAHIFRVKCAGCHGATGEGALGPPLHGVATTLTRDQQLAVVTDGRGTMLAFSPGLTAEQIAAVVDYTRTQLP